MKLYAAALAALIPCLATSLGDAQKGKILGNPSAPVKMELYSDFQCPACKGFHDMVLPELMREYIIPGKAYVVNHEFPLPMHPFSRQAADYATAAAHIGKYQQVVDALFRNQNTWAANGKVWDTVAGALTLTEQKKVQELAKEPSVITAVTQDVQLANSERITETPTIIITRGSKRYAFPGPGPANYPLMKSLIDGLLK
jgi:protein-disulfide isomerase